MCLQEVLRALHAHLGSSAAPQVSAALAALHSLSVGHASALLGHYSVLMAILDHTDAYTPDQLHTVCDLKQNLIVCMQGMFDSYAVTFTTRRTHQRYNHASVLYARR